MVAASVAMFCYMISYLIYETGEFFHWKLETTDGRKYRPKPILRRFYDEFKDLMAKRKLGGNAMSPRDEVAVRPDALQQACSGGGESMQSLLPIGERRTYDF